jgi:hypothetical protein
MPHSEIKTLTLPKLAALAGVSAVRTWRMARKGLLGPESYGPAGFREYEITLFERELGRTFTPEQIEAAARSRAPKKGSPVKDYSGVAAFGSIAQRNMRAALAARDQQWLDLIEAGAPELLAEARALAKQPF